jgi:hypothetical protein
MAQPVSPLIPARHLSTFVGVSLFYFALTVFSVLVYYYREIGWDGVDWIELAQDRDQWRVLVNTVMNLRVP